MSSVGRTNKLVTIPFSHYSDRARWALHHCKIPFVEKTYFPLFHVVGTMLEGGLGVGKREDKNSTKFSVPLLLPAESEGIRGSGDILEWANNNRSPDVASLYPDDPEEGKKMKEQEEYWSNFLGANVRRVAYAHVMKDSDIFEQICKNNMDPNAWQMTFLRLVGAHRIGNIIANASKINDEERVKKSYGHLCKDFDLAAEYFKDDIESFKGANDSNSLSEPKITAASITFATLVAPILVVQPAEGSPYWMPPVEDLPASMQELVHQFRTHPAGQFALALYKTRLTN